MGERSQEKEFNWTYVDVRVKVDHWLTFSNDPEVDTWDVGGWRKKLEDGKTVTSIPKTRTTYVDDSYYYRIRSH